MANKSLFPSIRGKLLPAADATNQAGAPAYALTPAQALAQYAATGRFNAHLLRRARGAARRACWTLAQQVEPEFVAQTAVYAREAGLHEGHAGAAAGGAVDAATRRASPACSRA